MNDLERIVADASRIFDLKHHCSEAIVMAVGGFYLDPYPDLLTRVACPFGGGVGGCRDELCGLVSGATIVLGALWGRTSYAEDDKWLYEVVCACRNRFIETNGTSLCRPLRDHYAVDGGRCGPLVEQATRDLVLLIEQTAQANPAAAARLARRATIQDEM
ncbi:MAG: C-GCAxxG-C-C family protein [Anaerolineae bacterium]|jgi:C_GCAxxG_C_C family probable redox protein|nr:C_GCAxxG_C_C family protein [Chloroflexota bacterium]